MIDDENFVLGKVEKTENALKNEMKEKINGYLNENKQVTTIKKPQTEVFYSDYGYLVLKLEDYDNEDKLIYFENIKSKVYGKIQKSNLRKNIDIYVKTFYGSRTLHKLNVGINDFTNDISAKLVISEDILFQKNNEKTSENKENQNQGTEERQILNKWHQAFQFKLIATSKNKIREINPFKTFYEEEITEFQTIIILLQEDFYFNEYQMAANIFLEYNNTTAFKVGNDDHQMILANRGLKFGKHYVEFKFETEPAERSVILGICLSRNDYYFNIADPKGFWGFIPSEAKKLGFNDKGTLDKGEYGAICKIGDTVGLLLEFTPKGLVFTFYINKVNMGVAFKFLPFQTYFPCAVLGLDSSKINIIPSSLFPE